MPLKQLGRILRRNVWLILIVTVLGGVVAFGLANTQRPTYSAGARVLFTPSSAAVEPSQLVATGTLISSRVSTYAALVDTPVILDPVIQELGLNASAPQIAAAVSASVESTNNIIAVSTTSSEGQSAAALANAVAESLADQVTALDLATPEAGLDAVGITSELVDPAEAPSRPSAPDIALLTLIGAAVGFGIGIVIAGIRAYTDSRIRNRTDIHAATRPDVPIEGLPRGDSLIAVDPSSAEAYRRFAVDVAARPIPVGDSIIVTSPRATAAAALAATNLALVFAENGQSVVLLDADLRSGSVAEVLGHERNDGLSDVLSGNVELREVVRSGPHPNLRVVPAGREIQETGALLSSKAMDLIVDDLADLADVVVINSAPVLDFADGLIVADNADSAVLVVSSGSSRGRDLADAFSLLEDSGTKVSGVLLASVPRRGPDADWR